MKHRERTDLRRMLDTVMSSTEKLHGVRLALKLRIGHGHAGAPDSGPIQRAIESLDQALDGLVGAAFAISDVPVDLAVPPATLVKEAEWVRGLLEGQDDEA